MIYIFQGNKKLKKKKMLNLDQTLFTVVANSIFSCEDLNSDEEITGNIHNVHK